MGTMGRPPKYSKDFVEQAYNYCLLGGTDEQLAEFFGVCVSTIDKWKVAHKDFLQAIRDGKERADAEVGLSLFQRARGYSHPEDKIHVGKDGDVTVVPTTKHYPPDTTACIFWLKNRRKDEWRDQKQINVDGRVDHTHRAVAIPRLNDFLEESCGPPGEDGPDAIPGQARPVLPAEVPAEETGRGEPVATGPVPGRTKQS